MENRREGLRYGVCGAAAGLVSGFFGGGGGLVLAPLLMRRCNLPTKQAFAATLCVMLPLCAVSAAVYALRTGLEVAAALPYLLGGLPGGIAAGLLFKKVPTALLRRALALFILYGGVRALFF